MNISEKINSKYLLQMEDNPKYIFHGSSKLINDNIVPNQGKDEFKIDINEKNAIYGTSLFLGAIPYAIGKGKVSCSIGFNSNDLKMKIYNGVIPEDSYGYIYVFDSENFEKLNETCQFVSSKELKPIEIFKVEYKDYKDCFIDKTRYEYINSPKELSSYMAFNIEYRWMNKNGILQDKLTPDMYTEYSLMSPEEVIKNNAGICVDQVELEREWFEKNNYNYEVLCIEVIREDSSPGHVFLIYQSGKEWCWFENAWSDYKGINKYSSKESLIEDITNKFIKQNNILKQEMSNLIIKPFPKYPFHFSYEQMDEYNNLKTIK